MVNILHTAFSMEFPKNNLLSLKNIFAIYIKTRQIGGIC